MPGGPFGPFSLSVLAKAMRHPHVRNEKKISYLIFSVVLRNENACGPTLPPQQSGKDPEPRSGAPYEAVPGSRWPIWRGGLLSVCGWVSPLLPETWARPSKVLVAFAP